MALLMITRCAAAGEVADPRHTFPRGVAITMLVVIATYLLPLLAALGVDADRSHWEEGFLGAMAFRCVETTR
jgi:amino acid transporter